MNQNHAVKHDVAMTHMEELLPEMSNEKWAEHEIWARKPGGIVSSIMVSLAFLWSLFQLWVASPLPYSLGVALHIPIINDTVLRYMHLAFAMALAFLAYPMFRSSPRKYIPLNDWIFTLLSLITVLYLLVFHNALQFRAGIPSTADIAIGTIGLLLLLEATRRTLGPPMVLIGILFLFYTFSGNWDILPDILAHKAHSLGKVVSHQWLTTEGVFGIAIGVSSSFVFLFVLFGALLEKAGAGQFFIEFAFSLLGHFRGGPAKAAVLASAFTGLISGSSIANVVTTGTFTIPLMRKVGFSKEKAGAVEVAAAIDSQIMPPVMGAAAFLMSEYVGLPYSHVVKYAFVPAVISYFALLYIVHLEAVKAQMQVWESKENRTLYYRVLRFGIVTTSLIAVCSGLYHIISWLEIIVGKQGGIVFSLLFLASYLLLFRYIARNSEETSEEETLSSLETIPTTSDVLKRGMHFILPIAVLIWGLMVEHWSPSKSAFWAISAITVILTTQKSLRKFFTGQTVSFSSLCEGISAWTEGMIMGGRNMISIGVATAAAGIVVGTISMTGVGQVLAEMVEIISGGYFFFALLCTAFIALIVGMGLPTTANYIVVAGLMANVLLEFAHQNGMNLPPIAVHMFVFYFGIMADITPPVGLAAFAAAAITKGDPIKTGLQGFAYSIRTLILPFFFIYNTELLLYNVDTIPHGIAVFLTALIAMLVFVAATQRYFLTHMAWWEVISLMLVSFSLFYPRFWISTFVPPYVNSDIVQIEHTLRMLPKESYIKLYITGENSIGSSKARFIYVPVKPNQDFTTTLYHYGLRVDGFNEKYVVQDVVWGSAADKQFVEIGNKIEEVEVPQTQPNPRYVYIPAFLLLGCVFLNQIRKSRHFKTAAQWKSSDALAQEVSR